MIGIPRTPLLLGLAGLIPFVWGLITSFERIDGLDDYWQGWPLLADYAMVILPFMSGVIWGFATNATGKQAATLYILSVIPALWAFFFILEDTALLSAAVGFVVLLPIDYACTRAGLAPLWWMRLRLILTAVVVPCLVIGHIVAAPSFLS
ncbi:DUF3429 domain-containing protein [Maritimibacter sp. DP1N21-5]|uniref:DUF3429 domain-containing protein n=1 Tax=Maritimibacter sp. DP1N21-5 TaxID=2836867 RepID=UPI001C4481F6|nr:DUF3429 domain-containing protein [Maritimibacter sp. DP1N21-5]MBV7408463.1 DUF3429 domain-containing protein [Maritimibacter sp. DP1N21-5]